MTTRILVTRRLPGPALGLLAGAGTLAVNPHDRPMTRPELLAAVPGITALLSILTDQVDTELLDTAGPTLRVVSNYAVGYNNIDVPAATSRGIAVTNTPGVLTETTADFTWALLLAVCRRLAEGHTLLRAHTPWEWAPEFMLGSDVHGKTLGIVGFGRIGQAVARRAHGFGMDVLYAARHAAEPVPGSLVQARHVPFHDLLRHSDIVSIHVPYNQQTHHMIGPAELELMQRSAFLINTARGPIVDEAVLVSALRDGVIAGTGLDVYEREPLLSPGLADLPNVVLAPHLGSATVETRTAMATMAATNVLAILAGRREDAHLVT